MKAITMPSFGADMEQGVLTEWLKQPGDKVQRGDVIAVVETDKGAIELDVFDDGVLAEQLIPVGKRVPVGEPIAMLQLDSEPESQPSLAKAPEPVQAETVPQAANEPIVVVQPMLDIDADFTLASPAARKLAKEKQIDLSGLKGSGPGGAVLLRDIQGAPEAPAAPPSASEAMRSAITSTVTRSKREIPHYYLGHTLQLDRLEQALETHNNELPPEQRLILLAPLLCAIARTLVKFPQLNGKMQNDDFQPDDGVDLANAINMRGGGLLMPVIQQAQDLAAPEMMVQLTGFVERAKANNLRSSDLQPASFTVTNIGDRGSDSILGVIFPPQVAILGLGRPRDIAGVDAGKLCVQRVMTASLSADHRVSDGHVGARFLHQLNKLLQKPEALWNAPR